MQIKTLLFALGAACAAAINEDAFIHPEVRRALGLEPRQTFGGGALPDIPASCTTALLGLVGSLPTPPPRLASAILGDNRNPCSVTVPSSLSSSYSSYESEVKSWYSESSDDVSSAFSKCTALSSLASRLPVCASSFLGGAAGGSGSGTETGASATATSSGASQTSDSSSSTGSSSSSSTTSTDTAGGSGGGSSGVSSTTAGAARETGMAMAALAAGIAAVVL